MNMFWYICICIYIHICTILGFLLRPKLGTLTFGTRGVDLGHPSGHLLSWHVNSTRFIDVAVARAEDTRRGRLFGPHLGCRTFLLRFGSIFWGFSGDFGGLLGTFGGTFTSHFGCWALVLKPWRLPNSLNFAAFVQSGMSLRGSSFHRLLADSSLPPWVNSRPSVFLVFAILRAPGRKKQPPLGQRQQYWLMVSTGADVGPKN